MELRRVQHLDVQGDLLGFVLWLPNWLVDKVVTARLEQVLLLDKAQDLLFVAIFYKLVYLGLQLLLFGEK